ncbi:hypothetical protein ANN_07738 [Periplaneta americana]|uniref:Uncharacterized protein n=1 Tax=Periplaneta americana TaxID=6978 RepID=A0ABQ8T0Z2_PERAM|nr:hypothetical protein ANN_07738 [Periplaneta americana]
MADVVLGSVYRRHLSAGAAHIQRSHRGFNKWTAGDQGNVAPLDRWRLSELWNRSETKAKVIGVVSRLRRLPADPEWVRFPLGLIGDLPRFLPTVNRMSGMRDFLNKQFHEWIGSRGTTEWPPRSCDLTPYDFSLRGILKNDVFAQKPQDLHQLRRMIEQSFCGHKVSTFPSCVAGCFDHNALLIIIVMAGRPASRANSGPRERVAYSGYASSASWQPVRRRETRKPERAIDRVSSVYKNRQVRPTGHVPRVYQFPSDGLFSFVVFGYAT